MADLFDRFESDYGQPSGGQDLRQPRQQATANPFEELEFTAAQSRRIQQMKEPEYPIFKRQDADLPGQASGITNLCVSSGWVTLVMVGNLIYRYNIANPGNVEHYEIKSDTDRVRKVFQDATGSHLLVCMKSKECYYIGQASRRPQARPVPRIKGQVIESVAWNKMEMKESSGGTGAILLGTGSGSIYETDILFEDSILKQKKGYFTEMHQLYDPSDRSDAITGLHMEPFPSSPNKCFVIATTSCKIYQFIGSINRGETPQFYELFNFYQNMKVPFLEIPGTMKDSQLHVWPAHPDKTPVMFGWLTGAGVYHGRLEFEEQKVPGDTLFAEKTLIPYSSEQTSEVALPVGMALTQFHCVLLYRDRVEAICVLNQKKVYEDKSYPRRDGALLSICMDPVTNKIYTHQKIRVWIYMPYKETRDVWKIYLEQGQYERAKQYAEGNKEHIDTILIRQADESFKEGKYHEAAISFSQSQLSFEEVALKFIKVDHSDALKTFLVKKLASLQEKDNTQQTMLTTWLIELFLNELGNLADNGEKQAYHKLQQEFHSFLSQESLRQCLDINRKTVYDLISSHGAVDDVVFFATQMGDYERVITHSIHQSNYEEALHVLTSKAFEVLKLDISDKDKKARFSSFATLYYRFSPILVKKCAEKTVDAWIRMDKFLEAKRLIPALIQCNQSADSKQVSAAIKYLEFCVRILKNTERAVHNFLISCYATSRHDGDYQRLLAYLKAQNVSAASYGYVVYSSQYALRLCMEQGLEEACVYIYAAMGLYEEAVDLSLKTSASADLATMIGKEIEFTNNMMNMVDLARQVANTNLRSKDTQKRLWLKIAEHVIKKHEDISKAMELLHECSLLKIDDILPFFPDFVTIDHFKDAICQSLTEYNAHIDDLKVEMKGATESAKNIRSDIQDIRNKCVTVEAETKCQVCDTRLLSQGFYMFPCIHAFHKDCLMAEVSSSMKEKERTQLNDLAVQVTQASSGGGAGGDLSIAARAALQEARARLDAVVGAECPYCGEMMIQSISKTLIPFGGKLEKALESWT